MRAASLADVDGSIRTRKNPVGVSLMVTKGVIGSVDDIALVGVDCGVGDGEASDGVSPESASLMIALSL